MYATDPQNTSPMLEAALQYAGRGWHVFPLQVRGKKPIIPKKDGGNGFKDATTDRARIEVWWTKWPRANIGIATGIVSNLIVLDVDGLEGLSTMQRLTALYGPLPQTAVVVTSRGIHIYLRGNIQCASSKGDGLDVRADGGYVVAPPSIHPSGVAYQWSQNRIEWAGPFRRLRDEAYAAELAK